MPLSAFDAEPLADAKLVGALDLVPAHDLRDGHVVFAGDVAQRVALLDDVDRSAALLPFLFDVGRVDVLLQVHRVLGQDLLLVGDVLRDVALREHKRIAASRGGDDVEFVLRVEQPQGLHGQVDRRGDLPEVHQVVDAHRVHGQRNGGRFGFDVVQPVVGVGVRGADECREVAACLAGQVVVDLPEGLAA